MNQSREEDGHCFSAWDYMLLSVGPQKKGLWDPQNSPLRIAESSVKAVTNYSIKYFLIS